MIEVTDYCGIVSGSKVDKSVLFTPFYGELGTAPMIEECPLNLECRVLQTVIISSMEAFIGEIVTVYTEERYLSGGLPDIIKINPIIFAMHRDQYFRLGEYLAPAYKIGKKFRLKS
jgi:flavin reductase (DIM6/NTAB) family NADH-FMN oxidoreductase RutF